MPEISTIKNLYSPKKNWPGTFFWHGQKRNYLSRASLATRLKINSTMTPSATHGRRQILPTSRTFIMQKRYIIHKTVSQVL